MKSRLLRYIMQRAKAISTWWRCWLEAGAEVNAHEEARIGNTPLGDIAGNCSLEMARVLIAAGADPTIRGLTQLSALDRAERRNKAEGRKVYELLVKASSRFKRSKSQWLVAFI